MTTYFDEQFGGASPGTNLSTSNTGFDLISGTAPTFIADSPIPAAQSMHVNIGTAALSSGRAQLGASRSVIYINYPIKANAAWATGNWFPHEARATATIRADCRFPSGVPTMRNGTTAVWTSSVTLSTGVWLWCEHKIDNTSSKQSFTVWDSAGAVVVASGDQTYNSGTMDNVVAGNTTSIANVDVTIGRIRIADAPIGPTVPSISATESGAAADAGTVTSTVPQAETGAASDASSLSATVPTTDSAAGSDAAAVTAAVGITESSAAVDALVAAATLAQVDVGSATDSLSVSVAIPFTEAATAAEIAVISAAVLATDAAAVAETLAILQARALAEAGAALDAFDLAVSVALADDGSADEISQVMAMLAQGDSGAADDAFTVAESGPTPRPNTGTTARPDAGMTARPDTGITPRP